MVDSNSLIFQVFHAIPEMSSPSGLPTNALYGFTRDMLFLRTEKKPNYLVCAFDLAGPTFRNELYAEYTQLHDYFGRGGNDVMHRLAARRRAVSQAVAKGQS